MRKYTNWIVTNEYGDVFVRCNTEEEANNWISAAEDLHPDQLWIVTEE